MNEQMKVQLNTYRRNLENKKIQSFVYSGLLLFTIVVFDVIGLYSLVRVTNRRIATRSELTKLNADLSVKSSNIDQLKVKLDESKYYLARLNTYIPPEKNVEKYMVDLVGAAAKNGLKQNGIKVRNATDEYVEFRAVFQGPAFQIHPFIKTIESIDRLSVVKEFSYNLDGATAHMWATMRIYYLER